MSGLLSRCSRALFAPTRAAGQTQVRHHGQLGPKNMHYMKRHKGVIPVPVGGSTKGTTLAYGEYGLRIKGHGVRLSAKMLQTTEDVIRRKLKIVKGAKVYLRAYPDIPVCIKGNETRMGKGKGSFEFWATRVPTGKVIFEIGGVPIRYELAKQALRLAADRFPTKMEFISRATPPRLGNLLLTPDKPTVPLPSHSAVERRNALPDISATPEPASAPSPSA